MIFESYAQNTEDVLVNRCFPDLHNGYYIDIGASEPTRHSATYALYLRGWRGISVDPLPERHRELELFRPLDVNICTAVGNERGTITLYRSTGRGGTSTIINYVGLAMEEREPRVRRLEVPITTLANICHDYVPDGQIIHVLKIDVEGAEGDVLQGADFSKFRPLVLIIESPRVAPLWERLLIDSGYSVAAYDGVNRWYALSSRDDLLNALGTPVNIRDNVRRVDALGSPFRNTQHPDHDWACAFGHQLLHVVSNLEVSEIVELYLARVPHQYRNCSAGVDDFKTAVRTVFGRKATKQEISSFTNHTTSQTVEETYHKLITSGELMHHLGRAIASLV